MNSADAGSGLAEFLAMGGHGLYVWLCFAAGLAVVLYNLLSVRRRERRYLSEYLDREQRVAGARSAAAEARADSTRRVDEP